jgi:membrane-bound lytic murein transglycosylase B
MRKTPRARRRRRNWAILASAIVSLPAALSAGGAQTVVNAALLGPVGHTSADAGAFPQVPSDLGATGASPHDATLSPQLLHDAGNPAALATGAGPQANLPRGPLGIPGVVLDAYLHAQQVLGATEPNCHLPWWLLAGIGKIESGQAENGEVDAKGNTLRPILGPELNGHGFAAIPASLGGRWTGDPVWQRAVGPMQFLPSTWLQYGGGGDPNNMYDSAIAAGKYLCNGGRDLSDPQQQAAAVFSYNHSDSYVQIVLIWANAYRNGVTTLPETTVAPLGPVPTGTTTTTTTTTGTTTITTTTTTTGTTTTTTTVTPTSGSTTGTTTTSTTTTTTTPPTTTPCPTATDTTTPTSTTTPTTTPPVTFCAHPPTPKPDGATSTTTPLPTTPTS